MEEISEDSEGRDMHRHAQAQSIDSYMQLSTAKPERSIGDRLLFNRD